MPNGVVIYDTKEQLVSFQNKMLNTIIGLQNGLDAADIKVKRVN